MYVDEIISKINSLPRNGALTLIGPDSKEFVNALPRDKTTPRMLRLDLVRAATARQAIDIILDDLAELALALWPDWDEEESCTPSRIQPSWRRAARRVARAGDPPRFRRLTPEVEFSQLLLVMHGLVLIADVNPVRSERAAPIIATLEWCRPPWRDDHHATC